MGQRTNRYEVVIVQRRHDPVTKTDQTRKASLPWSAISRKAVVRDMRWRYDLYPISIKFLHVNGD
jgi:hypothetical protein